MATNVARGTFTAPTSTGTKAITGLGFAPTAIRLWATNTAGETLVDGAVIGMGFFDGTNGGCGCVRRRGTTTGGDRRSSANIFEIETETGTQQYTVAVASSSLDSDGFTLNFSVVNDSSAWIFHYEAFGCDNAYVGWVDEGDAGDATTAPGFQPNMLFLVHIFNGEATTSTNPKWGFGVVDENLNQWGVSGSYGNFGATTTQGSIHRDGEAMVGLSNGSYIGNMTLTSWDASGFSWSESLTGGDGFYYLALDMDAANDCGVVSKSTSTSVPVTQSLASLGYTPAIMGLASANNTSTTTYNDDAKISLGSYDGSDIGCVAHSSEDGVSDAQSLQNNEAALTNLSSSGTVESKCTITLDDTPDLVWSVNDARAVGVGWWAIEDNTGGGPAGPAAGLRTLALTGMGI